MNEYIDNTKLDSFRWRLGKQQNRFDLHAGKDIDNNQFYYNIFTPLWLYESTNEYIHVILNELDPNEYYEFGVLYDLPKFNSLIDLITCTFSKKIYIKTLNELPINYFRSDIESYFDKTNIIKDYKVYKLIFWWLVALALDNDLYDKYLDYVVDAADIFGFTEDMMSDWCDAVIYWLNGNDIDYNSDLTFKSVEADMFFKK